jgi:hypothetical protein
MGLRWILRVGHYLVDSKDVAINATDGIGEHLACLGWTEKGGIHCVGTHKNVTLVQSP